MNKKNMTEEDKRITSRYESVYNKAISLLPTLEEKNDSGEYLHESICLCISHDDYGNNFKEDIKIYQSVLLKLMINYFENYFIWMTIEDSEKFPFFKCNPVAIGEKSPSGNIRQGKVMTINIMLMSEAEKMAGFGLETKME